MSDRSRLVLDRTHMVEMLAAADFYAAVPAFAYLQAAAFDAKNYKSPGCSVCEKNGWPAMRGVCDAFFAKLQELTTTDPAVIQQIKDWLSERKKYAITKCVIYYRYSSERDAIKRFEF